MVRRRKAVCALAFLFGSLLLGVNPVAGQTVPASPTAQQSKAASTASDSQTVSVFGEAGATTGNQILGGVGVAVNAGAGQQIFGMLATETGAAVAQKSQVFIGVKSDYPAMTISGHKLVPFSLISYGASIESLKTLTIKPPTSLALTATTVTSIATGAGLAQQYAGGLEFTSASGVTIGVGAMGADSQGGWSVYPFIFVAKTFK